ncbi:MAG: ornithine cyclodeaminase family protein, partial [Pseudomonadota bacterium]
ETAFIAGTRASMQSVSRGAVDLPLRQYIPIPDTGGKLTAMPGYLGEPRSFGVKLVSKFPRAADDPAGTHEGGVMLFDPEHGVPRALLQGAELTAIRTASASALATRTLARPDAEHLLIMGAGEEAAHHLKALAAVLPLTHISVWARRPEQAQALLAQHPPSAGVTASVVTDAASAVRAADVICTVTSAATPILEGAWLQTGTHVNLVGAAIQTAAEADPEVVVRSRYFTDYRASCFAQAGELANAMATGRVDESHVLGELGELLSGAVPGRRSAEDITVYKSLGVAAQDLAAAVAATNAADAADLGVEVDWC